MKKPHLFSCSVHPLPFLSHPQPTYINPLVAVRFTLKGHMTAKLQCRVEAHNIAYQNIHDPNEGKVVFYLTAER